MQNRQLCILAILTLSSAVAMAQVQVREAGGANRAAAPAAAQAGGSDLIVSLYNQVEALQQEVQTLRGVVEEQGYQLKRLQTEQRDRYLDIDSRLSAMAPAAALPGATPPLNAAATPVAPPATTPAGPALNGSSAALNSATTVVTPPPATPVATVPATAGTGAASELDEQELYRTALNLLLEEDKYDEAISMFQTYIDNFPQGRLFTNALYWQGEAYLLVSGFTQARDVFLRVLNEFPQDAKAAASMLKLGKAYKDMGEVGQASDTWRNLKTRFPESANEIRLAEEFLKEL